jgi:hypothetical protein
MMVERVLYTLIKEGLDWYVADATRFESFLTTHLELSAEEAAKARIYFEGGTVNGESIEARPPTLQHGYPRTGGPFPLWAITLGGESEETAYIGDDVTTLDLDGARLLDVETGLPVEPKGIRLSLTDNILVMAEHPDITLYYYSLLRQIIRRQRAGFIAADLDPPVLNGADLAPDPRYLPEFLFTRQLTVQLVADECWSEELDGFGTSISGIAVDDAGSKTAGAGSVSAGVTSYTES